MAVRTKLLASGRSTSATSTIIYTCPASETAILKSLRIQNVNTTTITTVILTADVTGFHLTTFERIDLVAQGGRYQDMWVVLLPGMEFGISNTAAIGVNFWLSGTELEGVAD